MEFHPFLEQHAAPNARLWYVLSAVGESPSERVGHTCSYVPGPRGYNGKVYFLGGATPSGTFNDVYVLDLDTLSWDTVDHPGLRPRYEHAAFIPTSQPDKIYVFAGADQGGNHNDIQVLDLGSQSWSTVSASGGVPSPRTYHTPASTGDKFVVYSGGQSGSDPVGDRQAHCFDASSQRWSVINAHGNPPKPRHGHLVVAVGNKVFVHGGMSGSTCYDDLHILDLDRNTWSLVKQKKTYPSARAAHTGVVCGADIYVFGGMNKGSALDDMYKLDTGTLKWSKVELDGPPPACRLDFAGCRVRLRVPLAPPSSAEDVMTSSQQAKEVLDQQLSRMGSAGSVRSVGSLGGSPSSAGSQRSVTSVGSLPRDGALQDGAATETSLAAGIHAVSLQPQLPEGGAVEAVAAPDPPDSAGYKIVDLFLVHGGTDTEGMIFDDCLVYLIKEEIVGAT